MASALRRLSPTQKMQLEVAFLSQAFRHGCLAASPQAAVVNDPFVCGRKEEEPVVPFLFSDIPDAQFREPSAILIISNLGGGTKS